MMQAEDILSVSLERQVLLDELSLVNQKEMKVSSAVHYSIQQYKASVRMHLNDTGMLVYNFNHTNQRDKYIELRFCMDNCNSSNNDRNTSSKLISLFHFRFSKKYLSQYSGGKAGTTKTDNVLSFKHQSSFAKIVPMCGRTRIVLEALLNHHYTGVMENIFISNQVHTVLLFSLECLVQDKAGGFACKFLANQNDRQKIIRAREVLLKNLDEQITIKELSREVGINECYLKKGFKEMFGTTIFEFYQEQRMAHAKYLLYEKGLTVTEVAYYLGYSSISHFSTAFRKHTGLKPCELLFRG